MVRSQCYVCIHEKICNFIDEYQRAINELGNTSYESKGGKRVLIYDSPIEFVAECPHFIKVATTMPNELKPCPFCGGEAHIVKTNITKKGEMFVIGCSFCGVELPFAFPTKEDAKNSWNERADNGNER